MSNQVFSLPDKRQLGYCIIGQGKPVLYFHGTASSRLEALLLRNLAKTASLQVICIDRPGYGLSTFKERNSLTDFCGDVNFLVEHLGVGQFGVLGWSGGGAFALTYLACFPERVTKAVIAGTPSLPFDVATAHSMPFARFLMKIPALGFFAVKRMSRQVLKANGDAAVFLKSAQGKQMLHGCSKTDLKFFHDPPWMSLMYQSMVEAFRQGNIGVKTVLMEHALFMKPWPVSLAKIPEGKLFIWQGTEDKTCRVSNAYLISKAVAGADLEVFQGLGHCVLFDNFERLGSIFCCR